MVNQNAKVSIIIPTFNRGHLIKNAILSAINQTYKNFEVIVIDDGSTDDTAEKIKEIYDDRVIYLKHEVKSGPSASRNRGIKIASGSYIAFLDSDDFWYPTKLEKQINAIENSSEDTAAAYCGMEFIDYKTGERIGDRIVRTDIRKNFTTGSYFLTPANVTLLIKKNILESLGGFDERLFAREDTELAIRIAKNYKFVLVDENLIRVTRNHDQLMANSENYIKSLEIIYEKHKDFLSRKILFGTLKQIANYYIIKNNYSKARQFIKQSFKYKFDIKTLFQLVMLTLLPFVIKYLYIRKYKENIPLLSGLKNINPE